MPPFSFAQAHVCVCGYRSAAQKFAITPPLEIWRVQHHLDRCPSLGQEKILGAKPGVGIFRPFAGIAPPAARHPITRIIHAAPDCRNNVIDRGGSVAAVGATVRELGFAIGASGRFSHM